MRAQMRYGKLGWRKTLGAALLLVAIGTLVSMALAAGPASAQPPPTAITVNHAQLERGGLPWIPHGVQIVGLVAPNGLLTGKYVDANAHFSAGELQTAVDDHADTIRFQVSEYGLDPQDPLYSPAYVQEVTNAVELARGLGLTVIVSLQAESPAGSYTGCPLPDSGAERVWQELAPVFSGDPGVMLELFNEPGLSDTPYDWQLWENGGTWVQDNAQICQEVGMQTLIDNIRAAGADNVIIVPGLAGETTLQGMPTLSDPSNPANPQLAYGIHYPSLTGGSTLWDRQFGNFSATAPVIVTEWYATSIHDCISTEPARAALLLDYLASKQIGMIGYAFDVPGTIIQDWSYAPTTYANFACGVGSDGPGQLLFTEYAGLAQAVDAPGHADPAWIVSYSEVRRLMALAPGLLRQFLDTPRTFVTGASGFSLQQLGLPAAIPTATYDSETALSAAVSHDQLPSGTGAVLYDDEHWQLTPHNQQLHPAVYYNRAAQVAHSHGLLLIAAPATDLVGALAPKTRKSQTFNEFLRLKIASAVARNADVYDVQAQSAEGATSKYATFVRAAETQAEKAHPGVSVLAGISTNPQGPKLRANVLLSAILSTQSFLAGYWLNDPVHGPVCPTCTGPYPLVVTGLLRSLLSNGL